MKHLFILIICFGCSRSDKTPNTYFGSVLERKIDDTTLYSTHFGALFFDKDSFFHADFLNPVKPNKYPIICDSFLYNRKYWILGKSRSQDTFWMVNSNRNNESKISFVGKQLIGNKTQINNLIGKTISLKRLETDGCNFDLTFLDEEKVIIRSVYQNSVSASLTRYHPQYFRQLLSTLFQIETPLSFMTIGFTEDKNGEIQVEHLYFDEFEYNFEFDLTNLFSINKVERPKDKKQIESIKNELIGKWVLIADNIKYDDYTQDSDSSNKIDFIKRLTFQNDGSLQINRKLSENNEVFADSSVYNWAIDPSGTNIIFSFEKEYSDTTVTINRALPFHFDEEKNLIYFTSIAENIGGKTIWNQGFKMKKNWP